MPDAFRKHMASLMDHLCDAGIAALVAMEDSKEITHDEKRSLQYRWVRGMRDAQIVMSDPKAAVRVSKELQEERTIALHMESDIRVAVEKWLEFSLGPDWRTRDIQSATLPESESEVAYIKQFRDAVLAKPSEVKKRLAQKVTIKCARCHQPGHAPEQCPTLPDMEVSPDGNDCADQPG